MLFKDVIELISVTTTQNDLGDDIEEKTYKQVYANKKPIRQSEFYQAMNTGIRPEFMFEVRSIEYGNEETLRFPAGENGKEYTVIRVYDKGEITEIVCKGLVN